MASPSAYHPPGVRPLAVAYGAITRPIRMIGHLLSFFCRAVAGLPAMLRHYHREFLRLLSDVTWGNGSLVVGGGTAGVILVLGASAGAIVGIEGYNALRLLGLGQATGLVSATAATRELAPIMAALAFAAQAGCRFTAQLGAMRISEEIDAMESLAIRPIPYLVTTRLLASMIAVIPLFVCCLVLTYVVVQLVVALAGGVSIGTYQHYFHLVMAGPDIVYSVIKVVVFVTITSTIQCYYGYYARGGPQGVGVAVGRAMRSGISVMIIVNLLLTLAFWGVSAGSKLGG
ncbi:ABC transporter permease [Rhodococcus sp. CX]|uniref:ABC transporter permease n=1 Tax=Rhodococcus sp. CX TaxID=2789880 RepID=UPI0018CFD277|nr:ABC transporter permease [Rhodococcus sp. CX]MBH0122580.1 ABC transporter permease [Rhodococcus sp. CX]